MTSQDLCGTSSIHLRRGDRVEDTAALKRASAATRWVARFANEAPEVSLEETQLVAAALAVLPTIPSPAASILREFIRVRQLVTVQSVFEITS